MSYLGELRRNVRPMSAAAIGIGTGMGFFAYTNSVFAPFLIEAFGWSRAQFALVGLTTFTTILVLPLIGRFTDVVGVRRMALLGTITMPLCLVAYSLQDGSFAYFLAVASVMLACSCLTSPLVYTRLIAERFDRAQGLALTIVTSAPAVLGAVAVQPITAFNQTYGWRAGYLALAAAVFVANVIALLLIPSKDDGAKSAVAGPGPAKRSAREDFGLILRSSTFWIIVAALVLCMLPTPLHSSQMSMMLLDQGLTKTTAATMVSIYAVGTIVGRIACGLALDHYPTHLVSAISMGVPVFGYFVLASSYDAPTAIAIAMFVIGVSVGAEHDLMSYLISRYFRLEIFSSTLGLVACAMFFTSASGALVISATLKWTDSFTPFLYVVTASVLAGSLLFLLLPKSRTAIG